MAVTLLQKEIRRHFGILQKSSEICDFSENLKIETYFSNHFFADSADLAKRDFIDIEQIK
jgi:hypothetical protein